VLAIIVAVTRRDFLKIMGASASVFVFSSLSGFGLLNNRNNNKRSATTAINEADAQTAGSWSSGQNTTTIAIHASLLPTGRVLYVAGSGYHSSHQQGPYEARLLNISTGAESVISVSEDLFCVGQAPLANGNILLAGGTLKYDIAADSCNGRWHGLKSAYVFDVSSSSFRKVSDMRHGRWYPTCVTLPDGKVFTISGYDEYGSYNALVEIYDPSAQSWTIKYDPSASRTYCVGAASQGICDGAGSPCYGSSGQGVAVTSLLLYPRGHLMPSGLVVVCGMDRRVRTWNPQNGVWSGTIATSSTNRSYGTSILLPLQNTTSERGKILLVGGSPTSSDPAVTRVEVLDFNSGSSTSPVVRTVSSLRHGRRFLLPVMLPDGKVVVFGGAAQRNTNPVFAPEMFDPATETWTTLASASVPRVYHGVALLLPDGRVWTAGSTPARSSWELRTEFFRPSYYTATRPAISGAPTVGDYGASITIPTSNASSITRATLLRLPDTTHHYDANMRCLFLNVQSRTSSSVTVEAPLNANLAPPGYYMVHILNSAGIPSIAEIIQIPGSGGGGGGGDTTPPSKVLGLTAAAATTSETQIDLNWTANTEPDLDHYNIYRGTTAGFPVNTTNDTPLAQVTTASYSDTGLTASTTYYYKVAAVDTSNNIGTLSNEASATTSSPPDTTPPGQVIGLAVTAASSSQLNLTWTANPQSDGVGHYNVYRGTTANFAVNTATDTPLATPTTNSYSDTGLTASTTYYYKVAAVDTSNNIGTLSNEASATTSGPGAIETFYNVPFPGDSSTSLRSAGNTRYGEEAVLSSSVIVNKSLKKLTVYLRRAGTPSGPVRAVVRRSSGDTIAATFNETVDSATLPTTFTQKVFTLTNPYIIQAGDRILIEYSGPDSVYIQIWGVDKIDGSVTRRTRFDSTGYSGGSGQDIVGTMSSG
jgi:chitodextrinase